MTDEYKQELARQFLSVLGNPDEDVLENVVTDDVVWSFPGTASISGEAHGVAGIMKRARAIAAHAVNVEIIRAVYGFHGVAMILHNTGARDRRVLDEYLAAVFAYRDGRIVRLDTYLSDVEMMNVFFA